MDASPGRRVQGVAVLREALGMRLLTLHPTLRALSRSGHVRREANAYRLDG